MKEISKHNNNNYGSYRILYFLYNLTVPNLSLYYPESNGKCWDELTLFETYTVTAPRHAIYTEFNHLNFPRVRNVRKKISIQTTFFEENATLECTLVWMPNVILP